MFFVVVVVLSGKIAVMQASFEVGGAYPVLQGDCTVFDGAGWETARQVERALMSAGAHLLRRDGISVLCCPEDAELFEGVGLLEGLATIDWQSVTASPSQKMGAYGQASSAALS